VGSVGRLLDDSLLGTEVVLRLPAGVKAPDLDAPAVQVDDELTVSLGPAADVSAFLRRALEVGQVVSVSPRRESLEDLFVRRTRDAARVA
jgi:hypothetical protein